MQSLWMLLASAMFAGMGACVKVAADAGASLPHVILFRGIPSVLLILFWTASTRRSLVPSSWRLHLWRNVAGITSMWMGFFAISHLPLSTAISLNYTAPLFIAGWMLVWGGSQRDPVRILAVTLGFFGVLAVLRPSVERDNFLAALTGLGAGALGAMAMMQIRELGRVGEPIWRTVFIFSCCVCITGASGVAIEGWQPLSLFGWLALVGVGVLGLVGQLAMTRAFGLGSALLTAALQYTTIIFAAVLGIIFWGTYPDIIAWAGMALIIASGLLSIWRTYSEDRIIRSETIVQSRGKTQQRLKPGHEANKEQAAPAQPVSDPMQEPLASREPPVPQPEAGSQKAGLPTVAGPAPASPTWIDVHHTDDAVSASVVGTQAEHSFFDGVEGKQAKHVTASGGQVSGLAAEKSP